MLEEVVEDGQVGIGRKTGIFAGIAFERAQLVGGGLGLGAEVIDAQLAAHQTAEQLVELDRANYPFDHWILPWRSRGDELLF